MGFIGDIYTTLLYQPILNVLVGLYQAVPVKEFALTIVLVSILSRVVIWPLNRKSIESQKALRELKPEIDKLQEKYKDNKEKLYEKTMELYQTHKINPLGGCLPLLLQMPIFIALYQALSEGLNADHLQKVNDLLYPFIPQLESINAGMLWMDLTKADPYFVLPVLVALVQFVQSKVMMAQSGAGTGQMGQIAYLMPLFFLFIAFSLPAGLNLYILLSGLTAFIQQLGWREFVSMAWISDLLPGHSAETNTPKE